MIYMIFAIVLILFIYSIIEYRTIETVKLTGKDFGVTTVHGINIIFISDIQYDLFGRFFQHKLMKKLVKKINDLEPDLVLFGGDYIHHWSKYHHVFDYLHEIKGRKVGVLGNHDYIDIKKVMIGCRYAEIELLVNETYTFKDITIVGLDDLKQGKPSMPQLEDGFKLLLIHEPDDFESIIHKYKFDISLAGHLHGGQVTLFGQYAPILPTLYNQSYRYGLIKRLDQTIYVTSGLGGFVFGLPIRFFASPEIVQIEL